MTTVILADPEATARWRQMQAFEAAGFSVLTAAQPHDLNRQLLECTPDALIVDRRLAGPGGEVVSRLRTNPRYQRPACGVLSLLPSEPERRALLRAGADWYIDKSALVSSLASAVRAQLDSGGLARLPGRQAPRARVALPVEYTRGGATASGETLNLGADGMFLRTPSPSKAGSIVLLGFALPTCRRWECFGRVVWTQRPGDERDHPFGMGIQFVDLEAEAKAALASFVEAAILVPECPVPAPRLPASRPGTG